MSAARAPSVDSYRSNPLFPRIEQAVAAILAKGKFVAPVDVLVGMGLLAPEKLQDWRLGRVPYLERVIDGNLSKLSRLLRVLRFYAHDLNLVVSTTVYMRWGKGAKQRLRFTKTGDPRIEEVASLAAAIAAYLLWQRAAAQVEVAQAESAQLRDQVRADGRKRIDLEEGIVTANQACARNVNALKQTLALDDRALALLQQAGTHVVAFAPQPTHPDLKAAALYNGATHQAMVIATGLPALTARDYQLWIIRGKGAPQPAGLLVSESPGVFHVELASAALGATPPDALAISIEPKGGSATPTDVAMVAGLHTT